MGEGGAFVLVVRTTFRFTGRGAVVVAKVESGQPPAHGAAVRFTAPDGRTGRSVVERPNICGPRDSPAEPRPADEDAVLLLGVEQADVPPGTVITPDPAPAPTESRSSEASTI